MDIEDIDIGFFHEMQIRELPQWILNKGVLVLRDTLTLNSAMYIREAHKEDPKTWWAESHFYWGMTIRNLLREKVCLDDELPSKNWDDYYVALIEIAVGVREMSNGTR